MKSAVLSHLLRPLHALLLAGLFFMGCDYRKDSENSIREIHELKKRPLRVGITESAPWTRISPEGEPSGIEVKWVQKFASDDLNAPIEWVPGPEAKLMVALESHQLDLVIGGIEKTSPHAEKIGLSVPYLEALVQIAGAPGSDPSAGAKEGAEIGILGNDPLIRELKKLKKTPFFVRKLRSHAGPIAARDFQLRAWNRLPGETVKREAHVLAVAPGENALLFRLDQYLVQHRAKILEDAEKMAREELDDLP